MHYAFCYYDSITFSEAKDPFFSVIVVPCCVTMVSALRLTNKTVEFVVGSTSSSVPSAVAAAAGRLVVSGIFETPTVVEPARK